MQNVSLQLPSSGFGGVLASSCGDPRKPGLPMTQNARDRGLLSFEWALLAFSWRNNSVFSVISTQNGQSVAGNPWEAETKAAASCTAGEYIKTKDSRGEFSFFLFLFWADKHVLYFRETWRFPTLRSQHGYRIVSVINTYDLTLYTYINSTHPSSPDFFPCMRRS